MSVDEIAEKRNLQPTTIFSHLAKLFTVGKDIDLYKYVNKNEVNAIQQAKDYLNSPDTLKPYYEYFKEEMAYHKLRLGLTIIESIQSS